MQEGAAFGVGEDVVDDEGVGAGISGQSGFDELDGCCCEVWGGLGEEVGREELSGLILGRCKGGHAERLGSKA